MEGLLDGTPVVLAHESGVAPLAGDGQRLRLLVGLIDQATLVGSGGRAVAQIRALAGTHRVIPVARDENVTDAQISTRGRCVADAPTVSKLVIVPPTLPDKNVHEKDKHHGDTDFQRR